MKKWDEIIKDKLEGYDSALPEGSLADFRVRRNSGAGAHEARRFPLVWVLAPTLAAGLAAVLLLRQPSEQDGGVKVVPQPSEAPASAVAEAAEDDAVAQAAEPVATASQTATPVSQATATKAIVPKAAAQTIVAATESVAAKAPSTETVAEVAPVAQEAPSTEPTAAEAIVPDAATAETAVPAEAAPLYQSSPFIPQERSAKSVKVKVTPVAGAVAGGGLLAALLTPSVLKVNDIHIPAKTFRYLSSANLGSIIESIDYYGDVTYGTPPSSDVNGPGADEIVDVLTGQRSHKQPFKAGVSLRMPLAERLNLTTGLEYSSYQSKFRFRYAGEKTQTVQYIGVPVRLDWTLASNRWLDVYVGGGLEGDYCIGATLEGEKLQKEGFGLSALAASGIQFNLTERLGLYVEPELTYSFPSESRIYETYRSQKPLFFSFSSGLRINIGNK